MKNKEYKIPMTQTGIFWALKESKADESLIAKVKGYSFEQAKQIFVTLKEEKEDELKSLIEQFDKEKDEEGEEGEEKTEPKVEEKKKKKSEPVKEEEIAPMFEGEELTEDFKDKAKTLFETAVHSRVKAEVKRIEEESEKEVENRVSTVEKEICEQVDKYITYIAEQWLEDNELAVESGLKTEITENFISGLKSLFVESYVEVPEDKFDLVEDMNKKVIELEKSINENIDENIELKSKIVELKKEQILKEQTEDLVDTQKEKIKELVEDVEFVDESQYTKKISVIKESYFKKGEKETKPLTEEIKVDDNIQKYLSAMSRMNRK